ncbi:MULTISPECIES: antibiotic biosynthesis monooxygenase family protein [Niastella]|uniref:Antibiotic biosynthesis monooxygenase n=1 Tax=Niastella soli TaxID=2821487 RepID=A0ABS3YXD7_9BACT|nr:antibiotic biosynthesis monooxygenase [Niastella soli]MBO9202182.1 antibiotic biosynthesis monooxygenase [Niastella soli]
MIVRLTYITFLPENVDQAKRVYRDQVVPVVKVQKGNLDCRLLEPMDNSNEYISMTTWETKDDADAYHTSGTYKELVDKVRKDFAKNPTLRVYTTESILEHA